MNLHEQVVSANSLDEAIDKAYQIAGTRKVIVFDGSYGAINCSPEMAEALLAMAPLISHGCSDAFYRWRFRVSLERALLGAGGRSMVKRNGKHSVPLAETLFKQASYARHCLTR